MIILQEKIGDLYYRQCGFRINLLQQTGFNRVDEQYNRISSVKGEQ
jgi:hypothetical protein